MTYSQRLDRALYLYGEAFIKKFGGDRYDVIFPFFRLLDYIRDKDFRKMVIRLRHDGYEPYGRPMRVAVEIARFNRFHA